jgi:hypothetical protein
MVQTHLLLIVCSALIVVVASARSTWSPCGLSMLSSITPLGEAGRGHRFRSTATWYVAGAVLGGATTGAVMALAAAGVHLLAFSPATTATAAALTCSVVVALDMDVFGRRIPVLRRQVNEVWLDQFRNWVYGAGFGWQIGTGFTTYVMTSAVMAMVLLAALTASPLVAFGFGVAFGTLRGLTVMMGRRVTSPEALRMAHRRLNALEQPVRWLVAVVCAGSALLLGLDAGSPVGSVVAWGGVAAVAATGVVATRRRRRPAARDESSGRVSTAAW